MSSPGSSVSRTATGPAESTMTMPATPAAGPQQSTEAVARGSTAARVRRARLVLSRVDPWSVMKLSFLLSIAAGIVAVVAVAVLWSVLDGIGVFTAVARTIEEATRGEGGRAGIDIMTYVGLSRVVGVATILSLVNIVLVTALSTLAAFLYNLAASLVGGLTVTLSEDV